MGKLVYSAIASLDGYIEDRDGKFDWAMPDEESHRFINDLERGVGTYLYGRRMYETMVAWESEEMTAGPAEYADFAHLWRAAEKVVYSRTLETVSYPRTRIEREFDPAAVRSMKDHTERDIAIAGPELAAHAMRAGLVDEYWAFLVPVVVGGGKPAFPDGVRLDLELTDERRFPNGMVCVRYRARI